MVESSPIETVSPLKGLDAQIHYGSDFRLVALPHRTRINLRGDGGSQFGEAVSAVTGLALPTVPNTTKLADDYSAELIWLGPDEWLFRCQDGWRSKRATNWVASLRSALVGAHSAVVDVSDYHIELELSGLQVLRVMRKLTPLDLCAAIADPRHCAQTRFANASVLLTCRPADDDTEAVATEPGVYVIQVRWSFARYLWQHLAEAAREFR